jgi:hypothetical protein
VTLSRVRGFDPTARGSYSVGSDGALNSLQLGNPPTIFPRCFLETVRPLSQSAKFRFECIIDLAPVFSRKVDHICRPLWHDSLSTVSRAKIRPQNMLPDRQTVAALASLQP